jgi:hypothetical protein
LVVGTELHGSPPTYDFVLSDDFQDTAEDANIILSEGMVTTGIGNHHGLVANQTYNPQFTQGFMLHEASRGGNGPRRKQVEELRLPPVPPRSSSGDYDFTHTDPLTEIVFSQNDWSGGAFTPTWSSSKPNTYAKANGVDARNESMLIPGMRLDHGHGNVAVEPVVSVGFLLRDPSFENSTLSTAWTSVSSPTSASSVTTDPRSGDNSARHARIDAAGSGDGIQQSLTNPTAYQGIELVVTAYVKKVSGTGGVRLVVEDNVATTNGSTITDTSYTSTSVTHTVNGSAASVTIRIESTGDMTFDADDLAIIPTGGVSCKGTTKYNDILYGIFGRVIAQFNGENGTNGPHWDAVVIHTTAAATDIVTFGTNVFVAFGASAAYIYGATTSWTTSTLSSTGKNAIFFTVSRTTLWKSETVNTIKSATNPVNGGSWSSAYTIGSTDRPITRLYGAFDTVIAGKEDGLWFYKRVYGGGESADLFFNITNEYDKFHSPDNFSEGTELLGWLWTIAANQSVFRTNLQAVQDVTDLVSSPAIDELSGKVRALTHDTHSIYMAAENGLATTDGRTTLMTVKQTGDGLISDVLDEVLMVTVEAMDATIVTRGTDGTRPMLFMMGLSAGGVTNSQKTFAWYIPQDSRSTVQSSDIKTNLYDVSIDMSKFTGGLPHEIKSLVSATLISDGHTAENVQLKFGRDGEDPSTISAFTFDGPGNTETLFFENIANPVQNARAREFQFQLILKPDTTNATHKRKVKSLSVRMTLRPERHPAWRVFFVVGGAMLGNGANQDEVTDKRTILTRLGTLETQAYPIALNHDFEQDGTDEQVRVIIRPGTLRQSFDFDDTPEGSDIWEAVLQQIPTS